MFCDFYRQSLNATRAYCRAICDLFPKRCASLDTRKLFGTTFAPVASVTGSAPHRRPHPGNHPPEPMRCIKL